jgi:PAS domain S-box-containing protein
MKPGLRQQKTQGNKAERPKRVGPMPVLMSADSGPIPEEELRRAGLLYSRLVNSVDCIVWEADARTFQFSFVSPQAERILGFAPEQWFSPGFWAQHVHPDDVEWCTEFCTQATKEARDHEFEYRMVAADGRTVWLHGAVSVQVGPEGPRQLTGVMIDITSRKVAEAARQESEQQLRVVFDKSAAGIVIGDTSGRIIRANQRFCELVGFSQDELLGRIALEITHPADRDATQAYLEKAKTERTGTFELEKRYVRRDGQVVWGRMSVVFVFPDNHAPYSICVVQDITRRKRAEELLRESEERFRTIFENAGLGTSLVDWQGHPVKCNPAVQKMLGYTETELRNMAFTEFTHPDDIDLDWKLYRELVAGKRDKYEIEKRYIKKNGDLMWGHLTVSLIKNKDGAPAEYTVGMIEDITERKRSEELLRNSQERFRTIFENAGVGAALVDWEGHPVKCNPALQRMLGFTESELRNMVFTEFTHPDDKDLDWKLYTELVAGKRDKYEIEKRYIKKDGQLMWGQLTVSRVKNEDGTPTRHMVGMVVDITDRKRMEEALKKSEEKFSKAFRQSPMSITLSTAKDHRYIEVNETFERMTGWRRDEVIGRTRFDIGLWENPVEGAELGNRVWAEGFRDVEVSLRRRDGTIVIALGTAEVIELNGEPCVISGFADITDRKGAELELRVAHGQLTKELGERSRAEAEIVRLSERLITAQEEERTRIARELHDDLSQQIAGLGIVLSNIKRLVPADQREAREQAERAYDKLLTIGQGIRHLSHELHPAIIEHSGLVSALESYCTEFESLTKVSATLQAEGRFDDLPANAQLGIYRIAQEALHNIWKHAGVREAGMCLARAGERVQLQISDRGVGFDPAQLSKEAGLGLISMRERARLLGGSFSVESSQGKGTTIIAGIPVNPKPLRSPYTTSAKYVGNQP